MPYNLSHTARVAIVAMFCSGSAAWAQTPPATAGDNLCSVVVPQPAPAARGGGGGRAAGAAGRGRGAAPAAQAAPAAPTELPRLVKVKDDVYVIQNVNNVVGEIGPFGGNITVYLTDEGVILIDSKNERMHDDVVAKVRSLTDKPIKYVILTHNHQDHSGGAAKMVEMGATVIISRDDRAQMARGAGAGAGLPQLAYSHNATLTLGGKEVRLTEYCGHTRGDTVAFLPAARVLVVGDLVTTPDTIPQIVNYGDGGNWTDMGKTLDTLAALDFDVMVGGHGPVLTKQQFLQHRDKVAGIRERARALIKQGRTQEEVTQTLLKEFNWGTGPAAGNIPGLMLEFK
jgi:glyoxylase-like metal-dependent hydrolase (beta-lactamase superfamily II)